MANFSKADLVERVTELNDIESKAAASRVIEHIIDTISNELVAGNDVALSGLCNFKLANQAAKSGVAAGTPYESPAKRVVRIRPAAQLKQKVL